MENALAGKPSTFYGLAALADNLPRILTSLEFLRQRQVDWLALIETELRDLFPGEKLTITIYPILWSRAITTSAFSLASADKILPQYMEAPSGLSRL